MALQIKLARTPRPSAQPIVRPLLVYTVSRDVPAIAIHEVEKLPCLFSDRSLPDPHCGARLGVRVMEGETKDRWFELCAQAAVEQDPDKLIELVKEISRLLDEKEARLKGRVSPSL